MILRTRVAVGCYRRDIGSEILKVVPPGLDEIWNVPPNLRTRSFIPGIPTPLLGSASLPGLAALNPVP